MLSLWLGRDPLIHGESCLRWRTNSKELSKALFVTLCHERCVVKLGRGSITCDRIIFVGMRSAWVTHVVRSWDPSSPIARVRGSKIFSNY